MVRPSANSTDNDSLVTLTLVAAPPFVSTVEELIPRLQQVLLMLFHQILDFGKVRSATLSACGHATSLRETRQARARAQLVAHRPVR
jgi:hypothetical protein